MARTPEGQELTAQHRTAQLALRARALQDFLRIWPIWEEEEESFARLVAVTVPLVGAYHQLSSALSGGYFDAFRKAEKASGTAPALAAPALDRDMVITSLYVTGEGAMRKAVAAGKTPAAAKRSAFVQASGSMSRHIFSGGRETLALSTASDRAAGRWSRVTGDAPCAFCAMLASRGPVYLTEETGSFKAHDHCTCWGEPHYEGAEWPGRAREFRRLWNKHAKGENPLNEFRRALAGAAE